MSRIVSTGKTISLEEYHQKRVRDRRRKQVLWSWGILILFLLLIFVSRLGVFQITEVEAEGARVITEEEISRNVLAALAGSYFWLVPKGNVALYPREEVRTSLMKEFPRFSSVGLSVEGENSLRVIVTEREPFALYCPPVGEKCLFLDKEGFIFDEAPDFSGAVYFIYTKSEAIENPIGSEFLPAGEFRDLLTFIQDLSKLGFEPVRFKDYELTMKNGSRMLLPQGTDLAVLYMDLEAFVRSPEISSQINFLDKVSLLDLRTENKVFYRFRE